MIFGEESLYLLALNRYRNRNDFTGYGFAFYFAKNNFENAIDFLKNVWYLYTKELMYLYT